MSDLIVGDKDGRGFDWVSVTLGACLGATITFIVGGQNGEAVGRSIERATVQCIDELGVRNSDSTSACWDMQAEALNKMELQRQAIDRLAERCVLSVPLTERLRVTKTRDHKPFKVQVPAPSSSAGSADWDSEDFGPEGDPDGKP
jgi:hypothetical protein